MRPLGLAGRLTQAFIRLKEEGYVPRRDLVLVFSGDEETGMVSTMAQAKWVAETIDPAFVLNSDAGGLMLNEAGEPVDFMVQGAEKTYATFEVTVTNPGGHSSRPRMDNAIYELADALKANDALTELNLCECTRRTWNARMQDVQLVLVGPPSSVLNLPGAH